jgi:hypothetical protein
VHNCCEDEVMRRCNLVRIWAEGQSGPTRELVENEITRLCLFSGGSPLNYTAVGGVVSTLAPFPSTGGLPAWRAYDCTSTYNGKQSGACR